MVDSKQIEKWVTEGMITKEQAEKMLIDSSEHRKEESSNRFVVTISTLGAILVGVGMILFIASNWQEIPDMLKTILLVTVTFVTYYVGYNFKYQHKDLPKVGSALLFLAGILFGVTLFLLAQIYHVEANSDVIMLIWLAGILPFVYSFYSSEMAGLALIIFYLWIALFIFRDTSSSLFGLLGGGFF